MEEKRVFTQEEVNKALDGMSVLMKKEARRLEKAFIAKQEKNIPLSEYTMHELNAYLKNITLNVFYLMSLQKTAEFDPYEKIGMGIALWVDAQKEVEERKK